MIDMTFLGFCGIGGACVIAFSCGWFFLMVAYAIFAECAGLPMPFDEDYLICKINLYFWLATMCIGIILWSIVAIASLFN